MASGALGGLGSGTRRAYSPGGGGVRVVGAVIGGLAAGQVGAVTLSGCLVADYSMGGRRGCCGKDGQTPARPGPASIRLVSPGKTM